MFVHENSCRWTVGRYFFHGGIGQSVGKNVSVGIVLYRRHFYRLIVSVGIVLFRPMVGRYSDL